MWGEHRVRGSDCLYLPGGSPRDKATASNQTAGEEVSSKPQSLCLFIHHMKRKDVVASRDFHWGWRVRHVQNQGRVLQTETETRAYLQYMHTCSACTTLFAKKM